MKPTRAFLSVGVGGRGVKISEAARIHPQMDIGGNTRIYLYLFAEVVCEQRFVRLNEAPGEGGITLPLVIQ